MGTLSCRSAHCPVWPARRTQGPLVSGREPPARGPARGLAAWLPVQNGLSRHSTPPRNRWMDSILSPSKPSGRRVGKEEGNWASSTTALSGPGRFHMGPGDGHRSRASRYSHTGCSATPESPAERSCRRAKPSASTKFARARRHFSVRCEQRSASILG